MFQESKLMTSDVSSKSFKVIQFTLIEQRKTANTELSPAKSN